MDKLPRSAAPSRGRIILYWITTGLAVAELGVGGMWDILRLPYVRSVTEHLGYPTYFLVILGAWKVAGAVALLVPGFLRLKEWAYAGAFFNYTGAAASHLATGYEISEVLVLVVLLGALITSWALRPSDRRL